MQAKTGNVTRHRYDALVRRAHEVVEALTSCQFELGDIALEIEPIQPHGRGNGEAEVYATLRAFADEIGVEFTTLLGYRMVAAAWPKEPRSLTPSPWTIYKTLAHLPDRFEVIKNPPKHARTGAYRWTCDAAARAAGHTPRVPESINERVNRIHDLASDETVASQAASDLLRRPDIAHRVIADPTARHMLNRAHRDRDQQAEQATRERLPAVKRGEHHSDHPADGGVFGLCGSDQPHDSYTGHPPGQ